MPLTINRIYRSTFLKYFSFTTMLILQQIFLPPIALALYDITVTIDSHYSRALTESSTNSFIYCRFCQYEIVKKASFMALFNDGWRLYDLGGYTLTHEKPDWTAKLRVVVLPYSPAAEELMGFRLNEEAMANGGEYFLYFHTDEWAENPPHEVGESPYNYGVISAGSSGVYSQMLVPNWGSFKVRYDEPPPGEPPTHDGDLLGDDFMGGGGCFVSSLR